MPTASSGWHSASWRPAKPADSVVVVVSAMGDTTDELLDLAAQVSPLPPGRELDMLLTAGERISMALLAMAIANLGLEARSFTGSQAGVITDSTHGKARIIEVTPGRIAGRAGPRARSRSWPASRACRRTARTSPRSAGAASDTTAVALAAALEADLCEIYTDVDGVFTADPRIVPYRPAHPVDQLRGDAGDGRLRGQGPAVALRGVRAAVRHADPRPVLVQQPDRHLGSVRDQRRSGRNARWNSRSSPGSRTTGARRRSPWSACRTRWARPRRIFRDGSRGRHQHRHDRAEHLGRHHRPAPTSRSRCRATTGRPR